jgi:hypothetical protein
VLLRHAGTVVAVVGVGGAVPAWTAGAAVATVVATAPVGGAGVVGALGPAEVDGRAAAAVVVVEGAPATERAGAGASVVAGTVLA